MIRRAHPKMDWQITLVERIRVRVRLAPQRHLIRRAQIHGRVQRSTNARAIPIRPLQRHVQPVVAVRLCIVDIHFFRRRDAARCQVIDVD